MGFKSPVQKSVRTIVNDKIIEASVLPDARNFKENIDGCGVNLFILKNQNNFQIAITNYGGRIVDILTNNNEGMLVNVVLGHDDLKSYMNSSEPYLGAILGRYSNLIAEGKLSIADKVYQLEMNHGTHSLNGGFNGFHSKVWDAKQISRQVLELSYFSGEGEGEYPGNMKVKVTYEVTNDNSLKIEYTATTDRATTINLANHTCFNLNGIGSGTILNHQLQIKANNFAPIDQMLIPTGLVKGVEGSPFDFRNGGTIGSRINDHNEQLKNGNGYDHYFVLNRHSIRTPVARVRGDKSGIVMEIYTDQPGLRFYTGNFFADEGHYSKMDALSGYRSVFCLETQHFPDSPNKPAFPTTILKPGDTYNTITRYRFFNT